MTDWNTRQKADKEAKVKGARRATLVAHCIRWTEELAKYRLLLPEHVKTISELENGIANLYRELGVGPEEADDE